MKERLRCRLGFHSFVGTGKKTTEIREETPLAKFQVEGEIAKCVHCGKPMLLSWPEGRKWVWKNE